MEPLLVSEKFLNSIGEDVLHTLKCSICLDYFDTPVILICGHTFCSGCIRETASYCLSLNSHIPPWRVYMDCPHCRKSINAYTTMQQKLPLNYTLQSFIEALEQTKTPLTIDATTNTEPEVPKDDNQQISEKEPELPDTDYEYNPKLLDDIDSHLQQIFNCSFEDNIVDDTSAQIDEIREIYHESKQITDKKVNIIDWNMDDWTI